MTTIRQFPVGCNGNCNQGRSCDCRPNVDDEDGPPRVPMTRVEAWMLLAGLCASAALVVWVAAGVWGML